VTATEEQVTAWVEGYVKAWQTTDPKDIAVIFANDAESYEWPYETEWIGLPAIIDGWSSRTDWQKDGWTFEWRLLHINGDTFAVQGVGHYVKLGNFDNLWVVTLNDDGKAAVLRMWNNEV
jgi:hypothetical protein